MAVSQAQIVDLLYKEAFGVTKTDTAANKSPSNESIPSPALNRGDTQWTQSDQIPGTAAATAGIVQAYTGASAVQTSADTTTVPIGGIYPTWKTNLTFWIPTEFGSTYNVQVWVDNPGVGNPTATGTQIFADGSGGSGQYFYNYQSGVLNFIGETIPAPLTSGKVLYIVGYRYIGLVGVTNLPSDTNIGNLNFTGNTITSTTGNISITSNVDVTGTVVATNFQGNGAALTNTLTSRGSDTNNWDALTQMGAYKVNRLDWSGTTGTPIDSTVYVGLLQVLTSDDTTTQIFFPGTVDANNVKIQWNRSLWSSTWTEWIKIVNDKQTIDAGLY